MKNTKRVLVGLFGLVIFLFSLIWRQYQINNNLKAERAAFQKEEQATLTGNFWQSLRTTDDSAGLEALLAGDFEKLPSELKPRAKAILELKITSAIFQEAEDELAGLIKLAAVTGLQEPHALAAPTMERIIDLYKKAKKGIDQLKDLPNDVEYNHCLNYLRGEIYYRIAQIAAGPNEINEIIQQISSSYKKALLAKPRDIETEINIEILKKNMSNLTANANLPSHQLIKQLPQQGVGSGQSRGKF